MRYSSREITEIGLGVALAWVLSVVRIYQMPQGGIISLEMLPIFLLAFRRGPRVGVTTGLIFGLFRLLPLPLAEPPFLVHPAQVILDYPLPFVLCGLAGYFRGKSLPWILSGIAVGSVARFFSHFASGVIFFASYAPAGQSVWWYSLVYNGTYMVPQMLICLLITPLVLRLLPRLPGKEERI